MPDTLSLHFLLTFFYVKENYTREFFYVQRKMGRQAIVYGPKYNQIKQNKMTGMERKKKDIWIRVEHISMIIGYFY